MPSRQQDLLREVPRVILLMDGDKAGRRAAQTIRGQLAATVVVDLPDGLDPDDLEDHELVAKGH